MTHLLQKNEALRQKADQLALLAAENERLSNSLTGAKSPASLSAAEFRELLRLRSQVGQLDRTRREADELRAANQQLVVGEKSREFLLRRFDDEWRVTGLLFIFN